MKGARPRGKHDTQLARGGDQLVKVSGVDTIVMRVLRHREEQEAKAQQKRLGEIRNIVRRLRQCCWPEEFRWPDKNDLERLRDLVLHLFFRIRKRRPLHKWKYYKSVDDHWHLRLWQTLSNLVDRAASNAPRRPLLNYDRRMTHKGLAEKAKEFSRYYDQIVHGRDPSTVSWEQFDELFKSVLRENISSTVPLTSRLGECGGKPKLVAYTVFLELFCADLQWMRKYWKGAWDFLLWVAANLQEPQMLRKLTRFLVPGDISSLIIENIEQLPKRFAEEKKRANRAKDRARKRRK
jgi:hypothetical protein